MLFYDPADYAAILTGAMKPYRPQPYATMDIDEHLFLPDRVEGGILGTGDQRICWVGETAYDHDQGFLYVMERFADAAKPVVDVRGIRP